MPQGDLQVPLIHADLGRMLLDAAAAYYERQWPICSLVQFEQSNATYLFDLASVAGAARENRTVAAWATTPPAIGKRDVSYQRGFPLPPGPDGTPVDRGHVISHLSGGEFGPNIFRQHRALNRGWSKEGKRFRALEREAAMSGAFYYVHLLYEDVALSPPCLIRATPGGCCLRSRFHRVRDRG